MWKDRGVCFALAYFVPKLGQWSLQKLFWMGKRLISKAISQIIVQVYGYFYFILQSVQKINPARHVQVCPSASDLRQGNNSP